MSAKKSRQWSFLLYLDSGSLEKAEEITRKTGLQAFRSPLHDKDTWTEEDEKENPEHVTGSLKKPHYHWVILFPNPRAMSSVTGLFKEVGVQYAEAITSVSGLWDYATHKNSPEKAQYDGEPVSYNGFSIADYRTPTKADTRRTIYMLIDYIKRNDITSFTSLLLGLLSNQDIPECNEMAEYVQHNVILVRELVRDRLNHLTGADKLVEDVKAKRRQKTVEQAYIKASQENDGLPF